MQIIYASYINRAFSHVWGAATNLQLLDKVQKRTFRLIDDTEITNRLDSLKHRWNVAERNIFFKNSYVQLEVFETLRKKAFA